jgi:CHAD domain-containing protein
MSVTSPERTSVHRERERSFVWRDHDDGPEERSPDDHASPRRTWPPSPADIDFTDAAGIESVDDRGSHPLDATYFDTPDLRLAEHQLTLRHRVGDDDRGWQLKVRTHTDDRLELSMPAGAAKEVPAQMADALRAVTSGAELVPVADISTMRREQHLFGSGGRELAVVAYDRVRARRRLEPGGESTWVELEVELTDGATSDLDAAQQLVTDQGLVPSPWWSKLARALGRDESAPARGETTDPIRSYLAEQWHVWLLDDIGLRTDQVESVHDVRVALRRIRATLATFRPLLDQPSAESLREALQPIGVVFGHLRDNEVTSSRLLRELDAVPPDLRLGPVHNRIRRDLSLDRIEARQAVDELVRSREYFDALERLRALIADREAGATDTGAPRKLVRRRVRQSVRRVERAVRASRSVDAGDHGDQAERDARLHEVRKAAKRSRYAFEAAAPVLGVKKAHRRAEQMEAIQEALGDHHDTVTSRQVLRSMGARAWANAENGFTFGILYAHEEVEADRALARYARARRRGLRDTGAG